MRHQLRDAVNITRAAKLRVSKLLALDPIRLLYQIHLSVRLNYTFHCLIIEVDTLEVCN